MENNHLTYFKVENFKKFESLEVNDIGQFNLIVGDNNVGKTCLLEAFLLEFNAKKTLSTIRYTFFKRKIIIDQSIEYLINKVDFNFNFNLIGLCQKTTENPIHITKTYKGIDKIEFLIENLKDFNPLKRDDTKNFIDEVNLFQYNNLNQLSKNWLVFKLKKELDTDYKIIFLSDVTSSYYKDFYFYLDELPLIKIDDLYDNDLIHYYQQIVKNPKDEEKLIKLVQKIYPDIGINRFSIFDLFNKSDFLQISTNARTDYHTINEYGDGLIRILRILFEILVNKNKYVIIDEIEIGIHYSKMKDFWINIFKVCKELDVQLFATTHSDECSEAFVEASETASCENDIRLIKLEESSDKEKIYSSTFKYNQISAGIESNVELRG